MDLFSKMIDRYALRNFHKNISNVSQYTPFQEHVEERNRNEFYNTYSVPNVTFTTHKIEEGYNTGFFEFQSTIPVGDTCNDFVTGEFVQQENKEQPNVIFVHGWRMKSNDRLIKMFQQHMKKHQWNMYYYTLPYHLQRKPFESSFSGEYMVSADIERTLQAVRQAVVDLRSFIHAIKERQQGPIFVVGLSLGGFITNLLVTVEEQVDAMVSIFYVNSLAHTIWNTDPGKFIKKELLENRVRYQEIAEHLKIIEPSLVSPKLKQDHILLLSAKNDQYVDIEDANVLWNAWNKPARIIYNCGHSGIVLKRNKIAKDVMAFLQNRSMR
ncbi:alpha/beta hydrolase [Bacillus sp. AFS002410]|uniref:alpha/beta hydrolase n=1 Tax=Bacillus sp. AFS002410 TaxID=2033481 RepID=UPI000BF04B0C|nr:alpha/beta hydrolase [Bacillus sp. AFS002410]PEJ57948.1 alpha/beta hydrolase [Bacillus sp. AFS002410]